MDEGQVDEGQVDEGQVGEGQVGEGQVGEGLDEFLVGSAVLSGQAEVEDQLYRNGVQPFHHPVVGDLDLAYDVMELPADPGQTIVAYTAEPGSPSQEKVALLVSWWATVQPEQPAAGRP